MLSEFNFTILAENRATNPYLVAEQGLCILVETPHGRLLYDTGQTDIFLRNAIHLSIDLSTVKKVVLSHGHYDHTGGLPAFVQQVSDVEIFCHPALTNKKYKIYREERSDIGVPWDKIDIEAYGAKFNFRTHACEIMPDVWISGEIPRNTEYEQIDEAYQQKVTESYIHDELHDDLALILNYVQGIVVLLGCGHAGPINTLKHAMRLTGQKKIHAVMGGMHLYHAKEQKIDKIVHNLEVIDPQWLIPLHCTGFITLSRLFSLFKNRVKLMNVGDHFTSED